MVKPRKKQLVTPEVLCEMFNSAGYADQITDGILVASVRTDRHPALPKAAEPFCTRSQIVAYLTQKGKCIALVHQYLRVDGSLGASGRPDPKWLFVNDTVYQAMPPKKGSK